VTTWLFVTAIPEGWIINPEPRPAITRTSSVSGSENIPVDFIKITAFSTSAKLLIAPEGVGEGSVVGSSVGCIVPTGSSDIVGSEVGFTGGVPRVWQPKVNSKVKSRIRK